MTGMTPPVKVRRPGGGIVLALLMAGILAAVNVIAARYFVRLDLTEDRRYSIAPATIKILRGLSDVVTVDAYFSRNLPPRLVNLRTDVEDLLDEYSAYAGGNLDVAFTDPGDDPLMRQKLRTLGIPEIQLEILEKDQFQLTNAFMGLALQHAGRTETIPFVQDTSRLEYDLTSAILRLVTPAKKKVAWLGSADGGEHFQGGGNPLVLELRRFYDVEEMDAEGLAGLGEDVETLVLAGPRELPEEGRFAVDQFIMGGGRVIALVDHFTLASGGLLTMPHETGVHDLLAHYGVSVNRDVVLEPQNRAMASFTSGIMQFNLPYSYWPLFPKGQLNREHPVTGGLESVVFPWTSSLEVGGDLAEGLEAEVLVSSSPASWTESGHYDLNPQRRIAPPPAGEGQGARTVAVVLQGSFRSFWAEGRAQPVPEGGEERSLLAESPETSILVVGTSRIAKTEYLRLFPTSGVFLLNAVDWMTFGSDLIGIRSRGSGERTLPGMPQRARTVLKVGNTVVLPALLALAGGVYLVARRRKKRAS